MVCTAWFPRLLQLVAPFHEPRIKGGMTTSKNTRIVNAPKSGMNNMLATNILRKYKYIYNELYGTVCLTEGLHDHRF